MEIKNIHDPKVLNELMARLDKLTPDTERKWGKMDVSQMLAHCAEPLRMALGDMQGKRTLLALLFGRMAKPTIVNDKPFKQGLPTAKEFVMTGEKDFYTEKEKLAGLIKRFSAKTEAELTGRRHAFFGDMTASDWSRSQYKHLDHHLQQFGV